MKIELIYLWINRDKHRCFQQMGFNFSPQYSVSYFDDRKEIQINQLDKINVFQTDRIANVTAVIGENGTGKTTLLEYLTSLSDIPLSEENRAEYMQWAEERNELNEFIAVYWDHEEDCPRIINITHDPITYNETRIQPQTANSFRDLGLLRQVSHIYLSNGAYENNQNLTEAGRINYVTITDKTLSVLFHGFYRKKYMFTERQGENTTAFNTLADILSAQENSKSMQMLIDLLFYLFLNQSGTTFRGKMVSEIVFTVKHTGAEMANRSHPVSYPTSYASQDYIEDVYRRYGAIIPQVIADGNDDLWQDAVYKLIFELLFSFEDFSLEGTLNADDAFNLCRDFIIDQPHSRAKTYYQDAIEELEVLKEILTHAEIQNNLLPQGDGGRRVFARVNIEAFAPLIEHIKHSSSFVLKYLDVKNLQMSSGERALLNFMSRLYFASQMNDFFEGLDFEWNENILLLVDEIDLYLHPEWQRQILKDLLETIQEEFSANYFQVILTSHSPIILSDIPRENSVFLRKEGGRTMQDKRRTQTFGANIHTLYKDAFFIKDGLAVGEFAKSKINSWIRGFKAGQISRDDMHKSIELIGEPIIRKQIERIVGNQEQNQNMNALPREERNQLLEFLKSQRDALQHQISILESQNND